MKTALTIAGSDPTGGAGLQIDLKVFKAMGVYGLSIPSVLTAQNTNGVFDIHELPINFFITQLDTLLNDILPDAVKTGMVYSVEVVEVIVDRVKGYSLKNLVIDPVTVSSSGTPLIKGDVLEVMKGRLFPIAKVITPNIYEASVLTGIDINNEEDMKESAVRLHGYGSESVIITGGHLKDRAKDILFDGKEFIILEDEVLDDKYHGTGCVFSSVITASLALGYGIKEAFIKAKEFTYSAMRSALSLGDGMKILNV
ncbi:MAG: bifunctional hydroxymethylpyrimidine kinase/phosphomethylpyrimidine kinase [Thermodesulfovibrionia bacterium]